MIDKKILIDYLWIIANNGFSSVIKIIDETFSLHEGICKEYMGV